MRNWVRVVMRWSKLTFGINFQKFTPRVRMLRLLEEVLELAQAENVTRGEAEVILNQVFSKPTGLPYQELGGVMTTLCAYAGTRGYDLEDAFFSEFERIMDPAIMEKVRNRNLSGDKIGLT